MKIRADYVTNSSSVSYIITMNKEIVDIFEKQYEGIRNEKETRILRLLHQDLTKNGTRVMLEGKEIYTRKVEFSTDECLTDNAFEKPIEEIDFSKLPDEDLWQYIFGEYILNGRISKLNGFGSTQVETY